MSRKLEIAETGTDDAVTDAATLTDGLFGRFTKNKQNAVSASLAK